LPGHNQIIAQKSNEISPLVSGHVTRSVHDILLALSMCNALSQDYDSF